MVNAWFPRAVYLWFRKCARRGFAPAHEPLLPEIKRADRAAVLPHRSINQKFTAKQFVAILCIAHTSVSPAAASF